MDQLKKLTDQSKLYVTCREPVCKNESKETSFKMKSEGQKGELACPTYMGQGAQQEELCRRALPTSPSL